MNIDQEDLTGAVVLVLLAAALGLVVAGVETVAGFDVLAAGQSAVGFLAAGNFSVGVLSTGIFSIGIFSFGIYAAGLYAVQRHVRSTE